LGSLNVNERVRDIVLSHIEKDHTDISITRQCELLGISRGSIYYSPAPLSQTDQLLLRHLDELYTEHPYFGARRMGHELTTETGIIVGRKHAGTLMDILGIEALYPKRNLSKNTSDKYRYPYLLKGVSATHPNHIWGTDITYIRMRQGFVYLTAFLDWFSRYVLSWEVSITLDTAFVLEAGKHALTIGTPDIANSDQGVQYTSQAYGQLWNSETTKISMDSRGRALDNIFTERLWRTVKYEEVYLKEYETVQEARHSLGVYFDFYNNRRGHQSHGYKTPAEIYFGGR